jgi:ADP-heptose:LPS heptosyltransferase
MKRPLIIFAVILALAGFALAQQKYEKFTNDRFFFVVVYPPDLLKMQPLPDNDDGATFLYSDGFVEMRAWGQYNAEKKTLKDKYLVALKGFDTKPSYMVLGPSSFVASGIKDDKIEYVKTLYKRTDKLGVFYTLTITYPAAEREKYDAIVTHIANSFRTIPGADI